MLHISHQQNFYAAQGCKIYSSLLHQWQSGSTPNLFPKASWSLYWGIEWSQTINIQLTGKTEALLGNTKATKSPNGAQLSITNLSAKTKTISNTQHRNSSSVTNKENINNKSGHSTATLRKYLNTPIITKPNVAHMQSMTADR